MPTNINSVPDMYHIIIMYCDHQSKTVKEIKYHKNLFFKIVTFATYL